MPFVWVILLHEYRCLQRRRHKHSPYHRVFVAVFCCIFWRLALPRSHLINHPAQEWSGSAQLTSFRGAPRSEHLSTSHFSTGASASRNTFSVSTITDGNAAAAPFLPLRCPDCTLSRLRAEEYDRQVTQSLSTLEPSSRTIPTLHRTLLARWSLECVATPGSRRSCPGWAAAHFTSILTVFTSLPCYLGALPG